MERSKSLPDFPHVVLCRFQYNLLSLKERDDDDDVHYGHKNIHHPNTHNPHYPISTRKTYKLS